MDGQVAGWRTPCQVCGVHEVPNYPYSMQTSKHASKQGVLSSWLACCIVHFPPFICSPPACPACLSCPPCAGKRATGDLFAIKVMRKADLIRKNMVQSVKNERNILAMANNPFVVRGYSSAWHAMEWNA